MCGRSRRLPAGLRIRSVSSGAMTDILRTNKCHKTSAGVSVTFSNGMVKRAIPEPEVEPITRPDPRRGRAEYWPHRRLRHGEGRHVPGAGAAPRQPAQGPHRRPPPPLGLDVTAPRDVRRHLLGRSRGLDRLRSYGHAGSAKQAADVVDRFVPTHKQGATQWQRYRLTTAIDLEAIDSNAHGVIDRRDRPRCVIYRRCCRRPRLRSHQTCTTFRSKTAPCSSR